MTLGLRVQPSWFVVTQLPDGLYRIFEPHCHRLVRANCFLIIGSERDILVHSGRSVAGDQIDALWRSGIELSEFMVDAVPCSNYDLEAYYRGPVEPTDLVEEGDVIETGDCRFEVLHLLGPSPGSIALWEPTTGSLYAGDAIYDGVLIDTVPGASPLAYLSTMERLKGLTLREVFGGHNDPMSRSRMMEVFDAFVASRQ
jgi:hypothetical protein